MFQLHVVKKVMIKLACILKNEIISMNLLGYIMTGYMDFI